MHGRHSFLSPRLCAHLLRNRWWCGNYLCVSVYMRAWVQMGVCERMSMGAQGSLGVLRLCSACFVRQSLSLASDPERPGCRCLSSTVIAGVCTPPPPPPRALFKISLCIYIYGYFVGTWYIHLHTRRGHQTVVSCCVGTQN